MQQRSGGRPEEFSGVDDPGPAVVRPSQSPAQRDRRIEGRACLAGGIIGLHQRVFGAADVGAVRKHLHRYADSQVVGQLLAFEAAALDGVRAFGQHRTKAVLGLADLVFQVVQRSLDGEAVAFVLRYGSLVGHAGLFQRAHRADALAPFPGGLLGNLVLPVEHQQRVIEICDARDQLRFHCLFVLLALEVERLGLAFGVGQAVEDVDLPACRDRDTVRFARRGPVEAAHAALRCEVERRQVSQARRLKRRLGFLDPPLRRLQVGIVLQPLADERPQVGVGEHLFPAHVADRRRVGGLGRAVQPVGFHLGTGVGLVDAAAGHGRCGQYDNKLFHLVTPLSRFYTPPVPPVRPTADRGRTLWA